MDLPARYDAPGPLLALPMKLWAWWWTVAGLCVWTPVAMLSGWTRNRALGDRAARGFSHAVLTGFRVKIQALELESMPEDWPPQLVIVSNHESNLDGPVITACLAQRTIRYVVKRELLKVPLMRQALLSTGNVPVRRQVKGAGQRALPQELPPGVDLLFFAEGTRSKSGALQPFKKGAFHFALAHGLPILPLGLGGTHANLPPGSMGVTPGPVAMVVGKLVQPEGSVEELRDRVHAEVERLRERARVRAAEGRSS